MAANKSSRVLAGRYPPPGTSPIADAIRARRGPRGITPLDAALLHVPPVAGGWNSLLGAVRTQGKLPGDVRELMILRVAAINRAAFEWIQHEKVGREDGLNNAQLYIVRDEGTPLPPAPGILTQLQISALMFADASTRNVNVGDQIINALKKDLEVLARQQNAENIEERTEDLLAEAVLVVAAYNMVSRFLIAVDVAGLSDEPIPWPIERKEHLVSLPNSHTIHAITITASPDAPWIVLANSLLTNLHMWEFVIPHFISDSPDTITGKPRKPFNILIHSQRGHGKSTLPVPPADTTIPSLASDISHLLSILNIPTPVHGIVGVSQGGAASLAFARSYPELTRSVVACDTSPRTAPGNKEAWAGRIGVVYGGVSAEEILREGIQGGEVGKGADYALKVGMGKLADITVPRWFPKPSKCAEKESERGERHKWLAEMVENTPVHGFVAGAGALSDYDLYQSDEECRNLLTSPIERVLLLVGRLDGGGNIGQGLQHLRDEWNAVRCQNVNAKPVEYVEIPSAGHLPMIDEAEHFAEILRNFLDSFRL
ncbi:hypothetical protein H2248_010224 [Termitomyces sp. 'cryptogamus']|nr:hypothetical protein H2248_010224 [Termitomyces sp. 'cryptogamus']